MNVEHLDHFVVEYEIDEIVVDNDDNDEKMIYATRTLVKWT